MALHPIRIAAAAGEYMDAALVVEWFKAPGDPVAKGDPLLAVETAKATTEIEADRDGWLAGIAIAVGEEAPIGAVLGRIADEEGEAGPPAETAPADAAPLPASAPKGARVIASPLARRIAAERGLSLDRVTGSGPGGRVKLRDLERAASAAPRAASSARAPLILLHGFGADRNSWRQVRALLPREIETVALDLPGHGSEAASPAQTLDALVAALSDRIDSLGVEEIHLAGHSLGGAAALAIAASGRHVVRSLSLIAPAGLGDDVDREFLAGLLDAETPDALLPSLQRMVARPEAIPPAFAEIALSQIERAGAREPMRLMAEKLLPGGRPAFDLTGALGALDIPLRLIWGREDRIIPPRHADAAPDHAALHLLRGVGHVPQMEAAALTARLLGETARSAG